MDATPHSPVFAEAAIAAVIDRAARQLALQAGRQRFVVLIAWPTPVNTFTVSASGWCELGRLSDPAGRFWWTIRWHPERGEGRLLAGTMAHLRPANMPDGGWCPRGRRPLGVWFADRRAKREGTLRSPALGSGRSADVLGDADALFVRAWLAGHRAGDAMGFQDFLAGLEDVHQ
jgi:hypothetical protein